MDGLTASTERFLSVMSWMGELEEIDGTLRDAGQCLHDELLRAEDERDLAVYDRTVRKLGMVDMLRAEVAQMLRLAQTEGQLPVRKTA